LGIILLSHTDTESFWRVGDQVYVQEAGLAPFNVSLTAPLDISRFFFAWKGSLSDPFNVVRVPPVSSGCSGEYCLSLFLPGGFQPAVLETTTNSTADSVIIYDIPGYQIEFYTMSSTDPTFDMTSDCKFTPLIKLRFV
jgi:hypothetical protein